MQNVIDTILKTAKNIAVVGLSPDCAKSSFQVAQP